MGDTLARCPDTWAIFATQSTDLAAEVAAACPNHIIIPEGDSLIGTLAVLCR